MQKFGYESRHIVPHGSYLINLANPDEWVARRILFWISLKSFLLVRSEQGPTIAFWMNSNAARR